MKTAGFEGGFGLGVAIDTTNLALVGDLSRGAVAYGNYSRNSELPREPDRFYRRLADLVLDGHERGAQYAVIGLHGHVHETGSTSPYHSQRLEQTPHTSTNERGDSPVLKMCQTVGVRDLIKSGFLLRFEPYDTLVALAATSSNSKDFDVIAGIDLAHSITGGVVRRDEFGVFHAITGGLGETIINPDRPDLTDEDTISVRSSRVGPTEQIDPDDPRIEKLGKRLGVIIANLGITAAAQKVVISGTVGEVQERLQEICETVLDRARSSTHPRAYCIPDVVEFIPSQGQIDMHPLSGARDAMKSHLVRQLMQEAATNPVGLRRPLSLPRAVRRANRLAALARA